jgi:cytochrome c biogenesis protein CcdA
MLGVLAIVVSIGLIDSVNPTTVGVALYLATARNAVRSVASFTLGVFAIYLFGGILLVLGPGQLLIALIPHPHGDVKHLIELLLGIGVLVVALVVWLQRERVSSTIQRSEGRSGASGFALGVGITIVELPTAFPYFAAIGAIVDARLSIPGQIVALIAFNIAFVAPLLMILLLRWIAGDRVESSLLRWRDRLHRHAAALLAAILVAVGLVLSVIGTAGLVA